MSCVGIWGRRVVSDWHTAFPGGLCSGLGKADPAIQSVRVGHAWRAWLGQKRGRESQQQLRDWGSWTRGAVYFFAHSVEEAFQARTFTCAGTMGWPSSPLQGGVEGCLMVQEPVNEDQDLGGGVLTGKSNSGHVRKEAWLTSAHPFGPSGGSDDLTVFPSLLLGLTETGRYSWLPATEGRRVEGTRVGRNVPMVPKFLVPKSL